MVKPEIVNQGKTVIEYDEAGFLILYPDGSLNSCETSSIQEARIKAQREVRKWYKRALGKGYRIGIGEVEWRSQ